MGYATGKSKFFYRFIGPMKVGDVYRLPLDQAPCRVTRYVHGKRHGFNLICIPIPITNELIVIRVG